MTRVRILFDRSPKHLFEAVGEPWESYPLLRKSRLRCSRCGLEIDSEEFHPASDEIRALVPDELKDCDSLAVGAVLDS